MSKRKRKERDEMELNRYLNLFNAIGQQAAAMSQRTGLSLDFCSGVMAHRLKRSLAA